MIALKHDFVEREGCGPFGQRGVGLGIIGTRYKLKSKSPCRNQIFYNYLFEFKKI
jgi:hypothetical protein